MLVKTGNVIATVAKPIAKTIDYFLGTDIQHCSGCKRMQNNLNIRMNFADAMYDRFWPSKDKEEEQNAIHSDKTNSD